MPVYNEFCFISNYLDGKGPHLCGLFLMFTTCEAIYKEKSFIKK